MNFGILIAKGLKKNDHENEKKRKETIFIQKG